MREAPIRTAVVSWLALVWLYREWRLERLGIVDPESYTDMIDMMTSCHQEVVEEARKF
jgi:hypothetical protein